MKMQISFWSSKKSDVKNSNLFYVLKKLDLKNLDMFYVLKKRIFDSRFLRLKRKIITTKYNKNML